MDLYGEEIGQVETTWERGGPGPGRRLRLFHNNTLNKILVFDLSWVVDLIRTNRHVGQDMGNRRRGISRSTS